jgi:hypothetical protein
LGSIEKAGSFARFELLRVAFSALEDERERAGFSPGGVRWL